MASSADEFSEQLRRALQGPSGETTAAKGGDLDEWLNRVTGGNVSAKTLLDRVQGGGADVTEFLELKNADKPSSPDDCSVSYADDAQQSRLLICTCLRRSHLSVTCRRTGKQAAKGRTFLNKINEIVKVLLDLVVTSPASPAGLVVVSGSTNSGKSKIATGLIKGYLDKIGTPAKKSRPPHLVTFEDPIEGLFPNTLGRVVRKFDYTPRQLGSDVLSLESALKDALRQTPAVFYVGEVRERAWWNSLVEFAGSGHLVVTTTHASSLQETLGRILSAVSARTPSDRRTVADRLLAVIHMLGTDVSALGKRHSALLPALWRPKPGGAAALMEYGLSSVIPTWPSEETEVKSSFCIGRPWFTEKLLEKSLPGRRNESKRREIAGRFAL